MSIIVAVTKGKRTVIANDTVCFCGRQREAPDNVVQSKVMDVGASLVGSSGWMVYDNLLRHYLRGRKTPAFGDEQNIFEFFLNFWKALRDKYNLVEDQPRDDEGPFCDLDADFLIVNRQGIFGVDANLTVLRFRKYHAIGSGSDYAFGALAALHDVLDDPAEIARRAVEVAIHFHQNCGGEAEVRHVPRTTRRPA